MHRFERLVASAAERLASRSADDAEAALAELRRGVGLWRGEPLQDVAYEPFAAAEVERLRELRATALEHEIDARLMLGRHEEAVPALRQLIAEYPLREHLRAQLVLALYRSGRQAEALRAFAPPATSSSTSSASSPVASCSASSRLCSPMTRSSTGRRCPVTCERAAVARDRLSPAGGGDVRPQPAVDTDAADRA